MAADRLRCGIYLPPMGPLGDPEALVDLAVRAEAAGWDGVFLWDHVVTAFPPIADTWTTLAAIAAATTTVRLGPMVTPLPRRRPWVVARQASTVSRLSRGRLVVGVGLGVDETGDLSRFGEVTDIGTRREMFGESLQIMRTMWSGSQARLRGRHHVADLDESEPEPHPIPIWSAASNATGGVLRRAVSCDGVFYNPDERQPTPDEVARLVDGLRAAGLEDEREFDVVVRGNASAAWPEPQHVDVTALADAGATWWMESLIYFDPLELSLEVVDAPPPGR